MRLICLPKAPRVSVLLLAWLFMVCWLACSPAPAQAQGISYLYDDLGRLIAVVSPGVGTAVYAYDVVGNLMSVTRYGATAVVLVDFTPKQGPIGATVTIGGAGTSSHSTVISAGTLWSCGAIVSTTLRTCDWDA